MFLVYKHTSPSGKHYIGMTKYSDPEQRWGYKGWKYRKQTKFYSAVLKYGWDNFTHEVLERNILTVEEAKEKEIYYVEKYDSYNNGYNATKGGDDYRELILQNQKNFKTSYLCRNKREI